MKNIEINTLRLILGDQLNINHSWYKTIDNNTLYVLMEIRSETDYAQHHIQKIVGFFSAMQNFAKTLKKKGHNVHYIYLNDNYNQQCFIKNCTQLIYENNINNFEYQLPDEYRVNHILTSFTNTLKINFKMYDTEHFYSTRNELSNLFEGKKMYLMETFYRYMRKKHNVLMNENGKPLFDKWNFDKENRQKLPKNHSLIKPFLFNNNLVSIENEIKKTNIKTIGEIDAENFLWPINREQSLQLLDYFIETCLPFFGIFQDAMAPNEWSIYHSRLSFSLNLKLISPKEVVDKAIEAFNQQKSKISYNQIEGFVRQIIGWREYMRGIYWKKMPDYASLNYFEYHEKLPNWYWTGETKNELFKKYY